MSVLYAHGITKRDQVNVIKIEIVLSSFKRKGAPKQKGLMTCLKRSNAN
jgi:hypothetical protein